MSTRDSQLKHKYNFRIPDFRIPGIRVVLLFSTRQLFRNLRFERETKTRFHHFTPVVDNRHPNYRYDSSTHAVFAWGALGARTHARPTGTPCACNSARTCIHMHARYLAWRAALRVDRHCRRHGELRSSTKSASRRYPCRRGGAQTANAQEQSPLSEAWRFRRPAQRIPC